MKHCKLRISDCGITDGKTLIRNSQSAIRNEKGFTLLEVMVAVVIMSSVLVTLIGLSNSSVQNVKRAEQMTTATMLANRMLTDMIIQNATRIPTEDEGTFPEDEFKDYAWKKTIVATGYASVMEVRVAVGWKEGDRTESVELLSYE